MGTLLSATSTALLLLLLLLLCCTQLQAQKKTNKLALKCWRPCPKGQRCQVRRICYKGVCFNVRRCEKIPLSPPSCQDLRCPGAADGSQVCVLHDAHCSGPFCKGRLTPTCIRNQCAAAFCGQPGTRCVTVRKPFRTNCSPMPDCMFTTECVPRARPKPGFCPPPEQVSMANVNLCEYDNDCPSDLLCCPGASRGGLNCTAPAYPNPCDTITCPPAPDIIGGTCLVRNEKPSCADRVCQPGSFFCRDKKQCYCSDGAEIICTNLAAPSDCST